MLYYDFQNYEGFKERFGVRECGNGEKARKNKILLSYVKQPELLRVARVTGDYSELNIVNMTQLWSVLKAKIGIRQNDIYLTTPSLNSRNFIYLCGVALVSKRYTLDEFEGVCEDGDVRSIRYVNLENHRVFKKKAGRFFNDCLEDMGLDKSFPEPVRLWLCEEFQRLWEVHASSSSLGKYGKLELHVNDNFGDIYSSDECDGDFGSCMVDDDYWSFYEVSVRARAAYLRNEAGDIVARCIVFTDVKDDKTGETVRLAERQYSTDGDECLKRLLVDALIKGGHIDGYKKVGAGCHANSAFVSNKGDDWSHRHFSIACDIDDGDVVSYQDSFVYYNMDAKRAYNYDAPNSIECLNTTDGELYLGYDDFTERYTTEELYDVHYNGEWIRTNYDSREEFFVYIRGDYYHRDEVGECPHCGEAYYIEDGYYSELTEEEYCCSYCMNNAEEEYKAEHHTFAAEDCEYFRNEEDVTNFRVWSYDVYNEDGCYSDRSISVKLLNKYIDEGRVFLCNGKWYEYPWTLERGYIIWKSWCSTQVLLDYVKVY